MAISSKGILNTLRNVSLIPAMVLVWLMLGMVYLDRFITPFDVLKPWLMPWKARPSGLGPAKVEDRLAIMQVQLDGSRQVA
ncbi:MAG: hypothetical protein V3V59_02630, partial [Thermodesulfovibrionales bacterium]